MMRRHRLSTVVLNWKEFRGLQLAFLRASTPDSEIPSDHAIVASFYGASSRHAVKRVVDIAQLTNALSEPWPSPRPQLQLALERVYLLGGYAVLGD